MSKQLLSGVNGAQSLNTAAYPQLPENVRRRVRAVKNLLAEVNKIDVNFYKELHALEAKYQKMKQPLNEKRAKIVTGQYEPTSSEAEFPESYETWELNNQSSNESGIPNFWLNAFMALDQMAELISEKDEQVLKHLQDVCLSTSDNGFRLDFHFEPNEFFSNSVLSKSYELKFDLDAEDVLGYAGPEVVKATGTQIDWKSDEVNPTLDAKPRATKAKNREVARNQLGLATADSFFNFFNPPQIPSDATEIDPETQLALSVDYEIGDILRQTLVQDAVLYFTGEALLTDDEDEDEEFDEEDESDEGY